MSHGAAEPQAVFLARQHERGTGRATDARRSRRSYRGVDAVVAARREIDPLPSRARVRYPGRVRGDHGLVTHGVEQERLDQLSLDEGSGYPHEGLARKRDLTLRNRPRITRETQRLEHREERFL